MKFVKYFLLSAFVITLPAGLFPLFQSTESKMDLSSQDFPSLLNSNIKPPPAKVVPPRVVPAQVVPAKVAPPAVVPKSVVVNIDNLTGNLFIANCNCSLPNAEPRAITYEDEKICGADRNYFSANLKKLPEWMREVREPFPEAQVGRECVALVMRTFFSSAQRAQSSTFVRCANVKSVPVRKNKIHCVTEPYVNSVYNALVDVSDCLNISQADLVAKLSNESGLHINAFGINGDTGIGQLTGDAISTVIQPYWLEGGRIKLIDYFVQEMGKSSKESCRRILSVPANYQKVGLELSGRCSLMSVPENPYRNMLYTGLYYRATLHQIAGVYYQHGDDYVDSKEGVFPMPADKDFVPGGLLEDFQIRNNLIALGIKNPDMKAVERAVVMLGYNAGPRTAANYLDIYLKKRVQNKTMLTDTDVDFLQTDFLSKWQKMISVLIRTKKPPLALVQARKTAYKKSFPEFLMIMQNAGAPGYVSRVALKHKELLEQMGDERCVSPNFIHF